MHVHERGAVAKAPADAQPLRNALASVEAPERFAAQADYSPESPLMSARAAFRDR